MLHAVIERVGELTPQVVREAVVLLADMMSRAGVTTYTVHTPEPRICSGGYAGYRFRADEVCIPQPDPADLDAQLDLMTDSDLRALAREALAGGRA